MLSRLADAYGRARVYRIGLVVFVAASISGGLAVGPGLLIASRVVQGIGAVPLGQCRGSPAAGAVPRMGSCPSGSTVPVW